MSVVIQISLIQPTSTIVASTTLQNAKLFFSDFTMLNVNNVLHVPIVLSFIVSCLLLFKTLGEKQALTFMRTIMNMAHAAHCMRTTLSFNLGPTPRKDPSIMIYLNLF